MEARVVHLQLLVALTAQRLWALNLHTEKHKHTGLTTFSTFKTSAIIQLHHPAVNLQMDAPGD